MPRMPLTRAEANGSGRFKQRQEIRRKMLREKKHEIFQRKGTAVRHCGNDGPQLMSLVAIEQGKEEGEK